jgi:lysophospholipase L1-like esterase
MMSKAYSKPSILLFGDSNTWGYNPDTGGRINYHDRWTTKLQELFELGKHAEQFEFIVEGLNGRTTVISDPVIGENGEYDCNGRIILNTLLHSHKPLSVVVIALGTNDLRSKYNCSPHDVVDGIRVLVRDVQKATNIGMWTAPAVYAVDDEDETLTSSGIHVIH